jgi:hypothetical protein
MFDAPSRFTKTVEVPRVRAQIPVFPLDRANQPSLGPRKLSLQSFPNQAGFGLSGRKYDIPSWPLSDILGDFM